MDDGSSQPASPSTQFIIKEKVIEENVNWEITGLTFDALSSTEIVKCSSVRITHPGMYSSGTARPLPHGPMDLHLGANRADKNAGVCETCSGGWDECVGHWGYVKLPAQIFHPGYFKWIIAILYCICKSCGSLLMSAADKQKYLRRMRALKSDVIRKKVVFRNLVAEAKKITSCPNCGAAQGMLRKVNQGTPDKFMKLVHEIKQREVDGKVAKIFEDLSASAVYRILSTIAAIDCETLDITRPEKLLYDNFPVPPSAIRPSINLGDAGINEDDLSAALRDIIQVSQVIKDYELTGAPGYQTLGHLETLQLHVAKFVNSEFPQLEAALNSLDRGGGGKLGRGVAQRLKGKEGRFRGNLSGKRVDFSGRTVISPDPNCPVPCVVVPMWSAKRLTFPERVCGYNIEKLRQVVLNGPDEWPGALSIEKKGDNFKTSLKFVNRRQAAANLDLGDLVERHLWDDDVVLFNRQPSLHRMSIMAHRARVMPWRTLRFNECVCSPYNADFDGDEMNCHLPQTQEARAEALYLMGVVPNLTTPKNAEPLVAATQDFLSGSWMICHKDVFFTRDKLALYCCYFSDGLLQIDIPPPAIVKPVELWTGKQLYNILLRPNKQSKIMLNFELKERDFVKPRPGEPKFMCPADGYIVYHQSELMCGALGKTVLGGGSKEGLFFHLIRDNNPHIAAEVMGRVAKLTGRWFANRGMTIGIDDVTPSALITSEKKKLLEGGYGKVQVLTERFNKGQLPPDPGCSLGETLENQSKGILDNLRNENGKMAIENLHPLNKPLVMFLSGAKGTIINMAQMIALVGQQNVNGKRIWDGFVKRTLPHYGPSQIRSPKAKGFVANSFYTGLDPDEFFFHTMSGREGLVDTAVKTADTGYMQRRLVKALEDLSVKYDNTVRTSDGQVVQFVYGDDGLNPQLMEYKTELLDFAATFNHAQALSRSRPSCVRNNYAAPVRSSLKRAASTVVKPPTSQLKGIKRLKTAAITVIDDEAVIDEGDKSGVVDTPVFLDILDPDVILPPPTDVQILGHAVDYFRSKTAPEDFPRSLVQKFGFLKCFLRKAYPYMSPEQAAVEVLGSPIVNEGVDPLIVQVRHQFVAHAAVWKWLGRTKQEAPLLPYEILKWAEFLTDRTSELQPNAVKMASDCAKKEQETHQPKTSSVRDFRDELINWITRRARDLADTRQRNGENPAHTKEEYEATVREYRRDVTTGRCARAEDAVDPRSAITNPLERRLWMVPSVHPRQRKRSAKMMDSLLMETEGDVVPEIKLEEGLVPPRWRISRQDWITPIHLINYCRLTWRKYNRALIQPGEAVGAIGAQSIGEPGTQMTLKTFHFAGVASMNVTLGVPRIKEIINASSKITTPIITVPLNMNQESFSFAQMVKARIERTTLGQICQYVKQVLSPEGTWVVVRLARECIQEAFMDVDANSVRAAILDQATVAGLKLRETLVEVIHRWKLIVRPPGGGKGLSFQITALMDGLLGVKVCGLQNVRRSIIQKVETSRPDGSKVNTYGLAIEGEGLREIMSIDGVDGLHLKCNNIMEVRDVLGIEAARQTIISEIKGCMDAYSMDIDIRHMQLLGDVMTFRGEVLGISRFGIQKMRASVLSIASFEETNEHLFEASVHKKSEHVRGVSEAIILGKRVAVGTGSFEVLHAPKGMGDTSKFPKRHTFLLANLKQKAKQLQTVGENDDRGETVCMGCGAVLAEAAMVDHISFTSGGKMSGQFLDLRTGNTRGFAALYGKRESREVCLARGINNLERVASRLHLAQPLIESAKLVYKLALNRGFTAGRVNLVVVSACLYVVCRKQQSAHLLIDFSDALMTPVRTLAQVFMKLTRALKISVPNVDPSLFMERFACDMNLGDLTQTVATTGVRLVQVMTRDWLVSGRRPLGLCAGALLIAARFHGILLNSDDIHSIFRVSQSTIEKRVYEFGTTAAAQLAVKDFETTDLMALPILNGPPCSAIRPKRRKVEAIADQPDAELGKCSMVAGTVALASGHQAALCNEKLTAGGVAVLATAMAKAIGEAADQLTGMEELSDSLAGFLGSIGKEIPRIVESLESEQSTEAPSSGTFGDDAVITPSPRRQEVAAINPVSFPDSAASVVEEDAEESLSEIDDSLVDVFLLSGKEREAKALMWDELTKDIMPFVIERKIERQARLALAEMHGTKPRKRKQPLSVMPDAITSVRKAIEHNGSMARLNENVLAELFG